MNKLMISLCLSGWAAALPVFAEEVASKVDFGGDVRARYEYRDNWPDKGKATAGSAFEDYLRFRTRIWGKADLNDNLSGYIRLGNEFRRYDNSPASKDKNRFPDELCLDNLYGEWKDDLVGVKIGRQDIKKGAGRLIADGTPGDGSRTEHFDAAIVSLGVLEKSSVDFIGTWNHYRDDLTIGHTAQGVYDLTKIKSGDPYSKMDEGGLMAYATVNEFKSMPFETYWIWKTEEDFYSKEDLYPGRNFHTVGLRATPKLTDWLSSEVEAAYQFGKVDSAEGFKSRDISAEMLYTGLTAAPAGVAWSPSLTLALLYLSGDKDSYYKTKDGSTDTGWNPVFNRTSWISEIGGGMYDESRWSNLLFPNVEVGVKPAKGHSATLQVGPMYAVEKDNDATDTSKGLLVKAKYGFPLPSFGSIKFNGAVSGELLDYGDYYTAAENTATFLRFEIAAKF